jgi:hypothetical protein
MIRAQTRRRSGAPPATVSEGLRRRACSLKVTATGDSSGTVRIGDRDFGYSLRPADTLQLPGFVDSNSPSFRDGNSLYVFTSGWGQTYRASGVDVSNLGPLVRVSLPRPERPGNVWIESVWFDAASATLYGWYHFEPSDIPCLTAPIIGAAVSRDLGLTWEDRGFVLSNPYGVDCKFDNGYFTGGNGDFSVLVGPQGHNLYFLFSNYAGPADEVGIAVARGPLEQRGQPGTVMKYYRGSWSEPGLFGRATALFRSTTGWAGPHVEAFWGPSVHWNSYLGAYVALLNHTDGEGWAQEGIYISFSQDLLNWSKPQKILESNDWYPEAVGLGPRGTDTLGDQDVRIYVAGVSSFTLHFD